MPHDRENTLVEILLVEDCQDEAELMLEALKEGTLRSRVTILDNGEQAVAYLRREGEYASTATPHLILLDLHLPCLNGHEVLAEIKQDALLRLIPVVVLTSSDNEKDILDAYDLHANCCVSKPLDQEQFALTVRKIEQFWLRLVRRL